MAKNVSTKAVVLFAHPNRIILYNYLWERIVQLVIIVQWARAIVLVWTCYCSHLYCQRTHNVPPKGGGFIRTKKRAQFKNAAKCSIKFTCRGNYTSHSLMARSLPFDSLHQKSVNNKVNLRTEKNTNSFFFYSFCFYRNVFHGNI